METLSNSTVEPLLACTPAWPEPMSKLAVVGAMTWVPLTERDIVTVPDPVPVTWKSKVAQVPLVMLALPMATLWKPVPPLS